MIRLTQCKDFLHTSNRTIVELKLSLNVGGRTPMLTSNRTIVELKHGLRVNTCRGESPSNRTIVELKRKSFSKVKVI